MLTRDTKRTNDRAFLKFIEIILQDDVVLCLYCGMMLILHNDVVVC